MATFFLSGICNEVFFVGDLRWSFFVGGFFSSDTQVLKDVRKIVADETYTPEEPRELCSRILHTAYLGTVNSSSETSIRADTIARSVGASHRTMLIDGAVEAILLIFTAATGFIRPKFKANGGEMRENLALQNIQVHCCSFLPKIWAKKIVSLRVFRRGFEWSYRISSRSCFYGHKDGRVGSWCWVRPTLMKGTTTIDYFFDILQSHNFFSFLFDLIFILSL